MKTCFLSEHIRCCGTKSDTHMFATYTESVESPYCMYCIFTILCYALSVARTGLSLLSTTVCHIVLHFVNTINNQ